ncbi:PLP-dependent transferase [Nocardia sp. NBC_00508]|uniref:hypothetical protein n=1 Tax=Nocardia sp. NBC_00508 TaxID=2975992 RepID=UPI002E82221E|nr:hypothetical protein [Nocardia sp. NBC_00508]WUD68540.1 PLP-dependent transferase [Nocardia sp. NBC_00508]
MSESTASAAGNEPAQWSFETLRVHVNASRTFAGGSGRYGRMATIGDVRSLVIPSASMTHPQFMPEEPTSGIGPGAIRLAVGIEDIRADRCAGFTAAAT